MGEYFGPLLIWTVFKFLSVLGIEEWSCLVFVYHGNMITYVTIFLRLLFCNFICIQRHKTHTHLSILDQFLMVRTYIIFFDKIKSRHRLLIHYIQRFRLLLFSIFIETIVLRD